MRITRFRASGYRSLRDFEIDGLGAVNVFYGPNGSGKSNILAALRTMFAALRELALTPEGGRNRFSWLAPDDFSVSSNLTARIVFFADIVIAPNLIPFRVGAELLLASADGEVLLSAPRRHSSAVYTVKVNDESSLSEVVNHGFSLVDAVRSSSDVVGQLFQLKNHPAYVQRASLDRLRALLSGPPLHRPPFDVVQFPDTKKLQLREQVERDGAIHDIPVELAGLGVAQLYSILSQIKLSKARAVAIEEPEAHLHGPTSGRHLRELLLRLVSEGDIDQLFVATHSNLFDLDPTGYFDVELVDGWTRATRRPLADLHEQHLYEPGPMKHVLRAMLDTQMERDKVMFRTREGEPVTVATLIDHLDRDTDVAFEYVRGLYGTAMELYGLRARKKDGG